MLARYRLLVLNVVLLLTLAGSFWGRRTEGATLTGGDFLRPLNLPFRGWVTTDVELSPSERAMLEPDAALIRRYRAPNGAGAAELAVIAGHHKRSVHTPGFCMAGGGWETLWTHDAPLTWSGGSLDTTRSLLSQDNRTIIITYFFTDGDYSTRNLIQFQGVQMLKRFRAEIPLGALVRIIVPVSGDQHAAEKLSDEFAAAMLPTVMHSLHHARLQMH